MGKAQKVEWLDAAAAAGASPAQGPFARVLVCDLRDPLLAPLRGVEPDAGDLADVAYAGASERAHFLERRLLSRAIVARCAGVAPGAISISYDEHGAPRVAGADVFMSVSSRGVRAALAVASSPVGVDLEFFDEAAPVIGDVLGKSERAALARLAGVERARAFLRIWTAKEAYLKAVGRGFKRDPTLVSIEARGDSFRVEDTGFAAELSAGAFAPSGDLVVACAVLPPRLNGTTP
ncbi:MAG: 4'-phosphopantetheinyl transferase family protein [Beijerinckiaceae bacterium]